MNVSARGSVIVTGSAGGLGQCICLQLAGHGWDILPGWHRAEESIAPLTARLASLDIQVRPLKLDMNDTAGLGAAVDITPPSALNTLIINAAMRPRIAPIGRTDLSEMQSQLQVSALGPFELIRAVWRRHFQAQHMGHLIAISTVGVEPPMAPRMSGYIVGKAALEAVVQCAMAEYGSAGLAATIIRPNYIDTPLLQSFEPRYIEMMREKGLVSSPEQVAAAVADAAIHPPPRGDCVIRKA